MAGGIGGSMNDKIFFEEEELKAWNGRAEYYFLEVLNGEKSLEQAIEDLASFRNSKYYTGTNEEFKKIKED